LLSVLVDLGCADLLVDLRLAGALASMGRAGRVGRRVDGGVALPKGREGLSVGDRGRDRDEGDDGGEGRDSATVR
jgi:hypothetical protein